MSHELLKQIEWVNKDRLFITACSNNVHPRIPTRGEIFDDMSIVDKLSMIFYYLDGGVFVPSGNSKMVKTFADAYKTVENEMKMDGIDLMETWSNVQLFRSVFGETIPCCVRKSYGKYFVKFIDLLKKNGGLPV